jgi:biopolymer transport protein ExbB
MLLAFELPGMTYFRQGGVCMYPLLLCSVAGVAVILYKLWQLQRLSTDADPMLKAIQQYLDRGDRAGAMGFCRSLTTPNAAVALAALEAADRGPEGMREMTQHVGTLKLAELETYLPVLSTVVNVAPLLGFLGTVTGMIRAFNAIALAGLGEPSVVAGGIAEALITTAAGLLIAIPCSAAYNYFVTRVNRLALEMERVGQHMIDELTDGRRQKIAAA